jgi:lipopolysaccharide/colanic/teichoic acid biosynthesis glycosyltransferase
MVHVINIGATAIDLPVEVRKGWVRRTFDVLVSLTVLTLTSPILLPAMLAIVIESPGNPFYLQRRLGIGGIPFNIIKLRTMVLDAERECGPVLADCKDPRATFIGRVLRRTHIDELPQFINVLKGEMAIVGPRPERPELHARIMYDIPAYENRLRIEPGITGLAQVRGDYHLDFRHKLRYDLLYIRKQCMLVDLRIMASTLLVILTMKGSV